MVSCAQKRAGRVLNISTFLKGKIYKACSHIELENEENIRFKIKILK